MNLALFSTRYSHNKRTKYFSALLCLQFSLLFSCNLFADEPKPELILTPEKVAICPFHQQKIQVDIKNTDAIPNFKINGNYYTVLGLPDSFIWVSDGLLYTNYQFEPNNQVDIQAYMVLWNDNTKKFYEVKSKTATIKILGFNNKECQ